MSEVEEEVFLVCCDGKWMFDDNKLRLFKSHEQAQKYKSLMIEKYDLRPSQVSIRRTSRLEELLEKMIPLKKKKPTMKIMFTSLKDDVIIRESLIVDGQQIPN